MSRCADGTPGLYAWVEKPTALIMPLESDGVWLVEQFRHPPRARLWEFPQGAWEDGPSGFAGGARPRRAGGGDRPAPMTRAPVPRRPLQQPDCLGAEPCSRRESMR
jgi:hypothetical protein